MATYQSDSDENPQPGTSTGAATPAGRRRFVYCYCRALHVCAQLLIEILSNGIFIFRSRRNAMALNSSGGSSGGDWRDKCRQLLDIIWESNDSIPFREPVDTIEHPGKYACIHSTRFDFQAWTLISFKCTFNLRLFASDRHSHGPANSQGRATGLQLSI